MRTNYKLQRLFIDEIFNPDCHLILEESKAHYIVNVLRMKPESELLVFNGKDGEWRVRIVEVRKKQVILELISKERIQTLPKSITYCFAPLKHARLDYMVQKAVEMGASVLQPVLTGYTQVTRINIERMTANVIEASEQCGILDIAECRPIIALGELLEKWPKRTHLLFCDEAEQTNNPLEILNKLELLPVGVLIGPEGGFTDQERKELRGREFVTPVSLGPRILRADTAAVAVLSAVGMTLGDW